MNCALLGVAAQQREEAVDVEVVERGLDLVEHVERARPREEDREQEGQRRERLLAAGQQRQALHRLAGRRHLDLDAEQVLLVAGILGLGLGLRRIGCSRRTRGRGPRVLAAEHRARAGVIADQPQPAAAAREELVDDLLEVARGRLEGLLEGLADAPVGLGDQRAELAQRGLEVPALGLELLDVGERLRVLVLGQRVDRAELLAAPRQPLDLRLPAPRAPRRRAARRPARPQARGRAARRQLGESASAVASRACWAATSTAVTASPRSRSRACSAASSWA